MFDDNVERLEEHGQTIPRFTKPPPPRRTPNQSIAGVILGLVLTVPFVIGFLFFLFHRKEVINHGGTEVTEKKKKEH